MKQKEINFAKFSSIKIGPQINIDLLEEPNDYTPDKHYILGSCNNVLIGHNPPPLMLLDKKFDYIRLENNQLVVGAATPSGRVASFCKKNNIGGFEFISHLPGTIGGLVKMNAGLKEWEVFNSLHSILTCQGLQTKEQIDHGYRFTKIDSPILEARFDVTFAAFDPSKVEMFHKMRSNQPSTPSAGSCFKNPIGDYAGRLIESVGLKGVKKGSMEFSSVHANFLVNHGEGRFDDAIWLIQEAQKRVFENSGIWLENEVIVLEDGFIGADSPLKIHNRGS